MSSFLGNLSENLPSLAALGNEIIANTHPELDNLERFPVFMSHYPDTTSVGKINNNNPIMIVIISIQILCCFLTRLEY